MINIRREKPGDEAAVRRINERAFGGEDEANLVDVLRARNKATLSLVALAGDRLVGHILFSPVTVESEGGSYTAIGLAPLAVLPEFQGQGVGALLTEAGLEECRKAGHAGVVVLGHSSYYPRFGFVPASRFGITCEFDVPDETFMAMELREGAFQNREGLVKYEPEFYEF